MVYMVRWTCENDRTTPKRIRVQNLVKTMETGPHLSGLNPPRTPEEAEERCRQWLASWIIPEVKKLFPEYFKKQE
jgi:hypothetical protein